MLENIIVYKLFYLILIYFIFILFYFITITVVIVILKCYVWFFDGNEPIVFILNLLSPGQMLLTSYLIFYYLCWPDVMPLILYWFLMLMNPVGSRVSPCRCYWLCLLVLSIYLINCNSGDLTSTSSQICGSWYLPIFLLRDGSLTLISIASLIVLVILWSSLPTMLKLCRDTS